MDEICDHLKSAKTAKKPQTPQGCAACLKMGDDWVHLRLCLSCGHVGCCDNSKNKHATKHFHSAGHPVIQSFEPDEDWVYCYSDDIGLEHPLQK